MPDRFPSEARYALLRAANQVLIDNPWAGDGTRRLSITANDVRVLKAIIEFADGRGQARPGLRAVAARAQVAVGTACHAVHRLEKLDFLRIEKALVPVPGRSATERMAATNTYHLARKPPTPRPAVPRPPVGYLARRHAAEAGVLRSRFGTKGVVAKKIPKGPRPPVRSVATQLRFVEEQVAAAPPSAPRSTRDQRILARWGQRNSVVMLAAMAQRISCARA